MAGFIRRFPAAVGTEVITAIEGVVVLDLPPPGQIQGVGTGTTAIVGEFADVTFGVKVDSSGGVTTFTQPVEVTSSADMLAKVGGFDETLGDFGGDGGSGFVAVRNKKFSRLILVPVNLASSKGVRVMRQLPSNKSATVPAPFPAMVAASVAAGREFKSGSNRMRIMRRVAFTDSPAYASAVDGALPGATGNTTTLTSAGSNFNTANGGQPVPVGDVVVVGVQGAAGASGSDFATYRVTAHTATTLTLERLDGSSFTTVSGGSLPFRIHPAATADSGVLSAAADVGGYRVPARPLDSTLTGGTTLNPTLAPPAVTANSYDPLSGLQARIMPGSGTGDLVFTSAVQAPNAPQSAAMDALYQGAISSLLSLDQPEGSVNIFLSARQSAVIRNVDKQTAITASQTGLGHVTTISPALSVVDPSTAETDADPGVGANRDERVFYNWPGVQTFIPEAVGFSIATADGNTTTDGILDTHFNAWAASVMSILAPERNPGEATPTTQSVLGAILGLQRGVSGLSMGDYINFRARGIMAPRIDRVVGPVIQSGITTSLVSGQKNANRRRMADFIEDSIAAALNPLSKQPLTDDLKDAMVGEVHAFLTLLQSPTNPAAQRIRAFSIDTQSGNTPELEADSIFVIIANVRTLSTADDIVLSANIGEGVVVVTTT